MVFNLRTFSFTESVEDDPTPPKSFSLKEIRVATHNFRHDNFIEEGTLDKIYWGRLADGSLVAVKRAKFVDEWTKEIFEAEMQVGSMVSPHPNVLRPRGFCRTKKELLVVYPLIVKCSLAYYLRGRPDRSLRPLDWTTRRCIALGVARGLAHLHDQGNVNIMHRDICSSTILLNAQFEAVIAGFRFAIVMHDGNSEVGTIQWNRLKHPVRVSSSSQGEDSANFDLYYQTCHVYKDVYVDTPCICGPDVSIAPEYWHTGKCTLKNDVYGYGKMLLDLISGQSPFTLVMLAHDENLCLEEWIGGSMSKNDLGRVIDPNLQGRYVEEEAEQLVRLALLCTDGDPSVRPKMSEVVTMIESQMLGRDSSRRSNWTGSEYDSTPYYSFPPSPSLSLEIC